MGAASLFFIPPRFSLAMILLLTNSHDTTTDILMPHLTRRAEVFRFNIDLWRDYRWRITADGYEISDPTGRICREAEVGAVYERKVMFNPVCIDMPAQGCAESWLREEVFAIWAGIKDLAMGSGKLAVIHPSPSGVWYKMRQMRAAAKYFPVLPWEMLHGVSPSLGEHVVCKTNSGAPTGTGALFRVSKVDPGRLDTAWPWFLQVAGEQGDKAADEVTVAYIVGKLFAAEMCRSGLSQLDSRHTSSNGEADWRPCELSESEQTAIRSLMAETGFSFSRLDFLRIDGVLHFLEFNVNGQFGWIDLHDHRGMMTAIVDEIMRVHSLHLPLPASQG